MSDNIIITTLQFDKVCRVCLGEGEMQSFSSESEIEDENTNLADILLFCTSLQVKENDGLPYQICSHCLKDVYRYYKFKQKCHRSNEILQCYITLPESAIKNEDLILGEEIDVLIKTESEELVDDISSTKDDNVNEKSTVRKRIHSNSTINFIEEDWQSDDSTSDRDIKKKRLRKGPPYHCQRCDIFFANREDQLDHRRRVKHPRKRNHSCTICSKVFTNSQLQLHMRTHTREKPFRCQVCGQEFSLNGNLRRHMMTHTGERPHKCRLCGKGFIQSCTLSEHMRIHSGETPFICSFCGRSFTQSGQLRTHLRTHSKENGGGARQSLVTDVQCHVCDRSFSSKGVLKTHLLIHGDKTYLCHDCGRGFVSMAGLQSHSKVHTGIRPFPCTVCNKAFSQQGSLKSHILTHTGVKPFCCQICKRAFTQRNHLKYHMRTHSGERPYSCSVCGKSFSLNGTLTVHKRTHTGETPYVCSVCGKGFYDSSSMKKHKKGHNDTLPTG